MYKKVGFEVVDENEQEFIMAVDLGAVCPLLEAPREDDLKYTIVEHIADLSDPNNGMTKELNFISWNNREPVYDIRTWNADHSEYGKGVTLTYREMKTLKRELQNIDLF